MLNLCFTICKSVWICEGHPLLSANSHFSALNEPHSVGRRLAWFPSGAWCDSLAHAFRVANHLPGTHVTCMLPGTAFPHPCSTKCEHSWVALCLPVPPPSHFHRHTFLNTPASHQQTCIFDAQSLLSKNNPKILQDHSLLMYNFSYFTSLKTDHRLKKKCTRVENLV